MTAEVQWIILFLLLVKLQQRVQHSEVHQVVSPGAEEGQVPAVVYRVQ